MISSGVNLVMTVIGFVVSTMFIVFVCTRLICARIQLHAARRSFPNGFRSDFSILERGLHGLEPVMVANFPTRKYSDEFFSSTEHSRCTVCLADYHKEDVLRILPSCGHSFHVTCIDLWLQQHSTCPVCRISLREISEKKHLMQPLSSSAARYHYGEQSPQTPPSRYIMTGHGCASRTHNNCGMHSVHEDRLPTGLDGIEAAEIVCPVHDCDQITKESGNKHAQSQSYL